MFFLSQDEKAKIPIGLPISNKQTALLIHFDHKISLPDHDFPIGEQHISIPSVNASCLKKKVGSIGYSGPTNIAIPSQKHYKSSASLHLKDFNNILKLPEFESASIRQAPCLL